MALREQIIALHRDGVCPADIAEALDIDHRIVELELVRHSRLDEEDIPEEDFRVIRARMIDIAKNAPDDNIAGRLGMFLWEQKRGAAKFKQAPAVNIQQLNAVIQQSSERVMGILNANVPESQRPRDPGSDQAQATGGTSSTPGSTDPSSGA